MPRTVHADGPTVHPSQGLLYSLLDIKTSYAIPAILETPDGPRYGFAYTSRSRLRWERFALAHLVMQQGQIANAEKNALGFALIYLFTRMLPIAWDLASLPGFHFLETDEPFFDVKKIEYSHEIDSSIVDGTQEQMMHLRRVTRGWSQKVLDAEGVFEENSKPRVDRLILVTGSKRKNRLRPYQLLGAFAEVTFHSDGQIVSERTVPLEKLASRYPLCGTLLELLW